MGQPVRWERAVTLVLTLISLVLVLTVPLGVLVYLTLRTRSIWVAAGAVAVAAPLQLIGFTDTCNEGSEQAFLIGAVLSTPFLIGAIVSAWWTFRARLRARAGAIVTMALALALVVLTRDTWLSTLLHGTPCGRDYADNDTSLAMVAIVLLGYLVLPLLVIAHAFRAVRGA